MELIGLKMISYYKHILTRNSDIDSAVLILVNGWMCLCGHAIGCVAIVAAAVALALMAILSMLVLLLADIVAIVGAKTTMEVIAIHTYTY